MDFLKNRYLYHEHLLSYSTRVKARELINMLIFTRINIDALELKAVGHTIFRITEIIPDSGGDIYGIEVLVPTDKAFKSEGQCIYKPEFKIDNAISYMFYDINEICDTETRLYGYARKNNMKPITDIYFVFLQGEKGNTANVVFEAYVGISNN
ncbi:MAG: hypothetical protein K2G04_09240, partial [Oscillospiraceae bacterium]|nr:hypothetical protein [Oscillospiraceae bacterium]